MGDIILNAQLYMWKNDSPLRLLTSFLIATQIYVAPVNVHK